MKTSMKVKTVMVFTAIAALAVSFHLSGCAETGNEYASSEPVKKIGGETELMTASKNREIDKVQRLLSGSTSPNQQDAFGDAALHYLFADAAPEDCTGDSEESDKIVKLLLAKGADPSIRNKRGISPLTLAAQCPASETFRLFLQHSKKLDLTPDEDGDTLLHMAARGGSGETVRLILGEIAGGKVLLDKRNNDGETALFSAAGINAVDGGGTIDSYGAPLDTTNSRMLGGGNQAFRELLKAGAEFNLTDREGTILSKLINEGDHSNMVQLLKKGVSPNQPDIDGVLPVQQAISRCDGMGAHILIQAGANTNATGSIGLNAAELAEIKKEVCFDDTQKVLMKKIARKAARK
jgi:ankyrin repeat protein